MREGWECEAGRGERGMEKGESVRGTEGRAGEQRGRERRDQTGGERASHTTKHTCAAGQTYIATTTSTTKQACVNMQTLCCFLATILF